MVKDLQKKFVLVTMLYLTIVIAVLILADTLYSAHLDDLNTRDLLEWIASGNILFGTDEEIDSEMTLQEIEEEDIPIVGVILDNEGKVIFQKFLGESCEKTVDKNVVDRIADQPDDSYKTGSYIYSKRKLKSGNTLIVFMDTSSHEHSCLRVIYAALIIAVAIAILFFITLNLSRYVTEPARKALEREKQFISDASHELKTPLGAISVNAQALELDEKNSIYIRNIVSETSRMNRLIERLLTLSRLEENDEKNDRDFSLSDLLEEMILTYESVAYEKNAELIKDIQEAVTFRGDEDDIRQLIVILLDNAIKNTDEGGKIKVSFASDKNCIKLTVRNSGEIIKKDDLEHIFERFYTTDQSRSGGSFGLGLSIAQAIVNRHDGNISASSSEDEGTIFTVCFYHR